MKRKVLITGGFGFIGSNLVRHWLRNSSDDIIVLDSMTYAARPQWAIDAMREANEEEGYDRCQVAHIDLTDFYSVLGVIEHFQPNVVVHLAAESHVCNSIKGPRAFLESNVIGTFNLLEAIRQWESKKCWDYDGSWNKRTIFHHVSTDEVYGELGPSDPSWTLSSPYDPRSPYAATKAASDHLVRAYMHTYDIRATISNCTNNFGPNQHPEKLIPRTVKKFLAGEPATIYGSGDQVRDWLFVEDHCSAIFSIVEQGIKGEQFLVAGSNELKNITVVNMVGEIMRELGAIKDYDLTFTNDRPKDDFRYSLDPESTFRIGWLCQPKENFKDLLRATIAWYLEDQTRLEE